MPAVLTQHVYPQNINTVENRYRAYTDKHQVQVIVASAQTSRRMDRTLVICQYNDTGHASILLEAFFQMTIYQA